MQLFKLTISSILGFSLLATLACAQDLDFPNKAQRQGMSYEEYSALREKMRARLENMTPAERAAMREKWQNLRSERREQREKMQDVPHQHYDGQRAYGQGYHARKRDMEQTDMRPDKSALPQRMEHNQRR
jgi:hypothetical protein